MVPKAAASSDVQIKNQALRMDVELAEKDVKLKTLSEVVAR